MQASTDILADWQERGFVVLRRAQWLGRVMGPRGEHLHLARSAGGARAPGVKFQNCENAEPALRAACWRRACKRS